MVGTPTAMYGSLQSICYQHEVIAPTNSRRAARVVAAGLRAKVVTKFGKLPFPVAATLHKSAGRAETATLHSALRKQEFVLEKQKLETEVKGEVVNLSADLGLLGDDTEPGEGKAAMALTLIQRYGRMAFSALSCKEHVAQHLSTSMDKATNIPTLLLQIVDSSQDLQGHIRRKRVQGGKQPLLTVKEFARDMLEHLVARRLITFKHSRARVWLVLSLDTLVKF